MDNTLYWIHLPSHTDPTAEGYVGITVDLERRTMDHRKTFENYFHQGAVVTVLHSGLTREKAMVLEADLRPVANIGWNTHPGSVKRINGKPIVSTTGTSTSKMVNLRIDPDLWKRFQIHCKELGETMASRMRLLMTEDIEGNRLETQLDLFYDQQDIP